jgi:cytochrome c
VTPCQIRPSGGATTHTHKLSNREAWDIAKFITRQLVTAQALQAYKRSRKLAGLGERPPEP